MSGAEMDTAAGFWVIVVTLSTNHLVQRRCAARPPPCSFFMQKEHSCFVPFLALPGAKEGTTSGFWGYVVILSTVLPCHGGRAARPSLCLLFRQKQPICVAPFLALPSVENGVRGDFRGRLRLYRSHRQSHLLSLLHKQRRIVSSQIRLCCCCRQEKAPITDLIL